MSNLTSLAYNFMVVYDSPVRTSRFNKNIKNSAKTLSEVKFFVLSQYIVQSLID